MPLESLQKGEVTSFQGKSTTYTVETYKSDRIKGFTQMPDYNELVEVVTDLYLNRYPQRGREPSIDRVRRSMSHPRTILLLARQQGVPIGFGIFSRLYLSREPILYASPVFQEDQEDEGLEMEVLNKAIQLHEEDVATSYRFIRFGVLTTQNPFLVGRLEQLPAIETIFPFHQRYNKNPEAQKIMLEVHRKVMINSQSIYTETGVSKGELLEIEINETYRPRRVNKRIWEIYQEMVSPPPGLDMNRERGDVVYITFKLKRPQSN